MSKKSGISVLVIALIALCLSIVSLLLAQKAAKQDGKAVQEAGDIQYVMYLGTNDKDTNEPVFGPEGAKSLAEDILVKHFGGYTIQEANGGWEDSGIRYQEYTLVIYLSDTTPDAIHAAADDLIRTFHQSSVLIQANRTVTEFYAGNA